MRALPLTLALLVVAGCDKVRVTSPVDAGPVCGVGERLVNGTCRFVCNRDGECPSGQRCDLLVGQCVPRPAEPDAGEVRIPCTEGAARCASDGRGVETCSEQGVFAVSEQCAQPDGYCQNERCLTCRPGASRCTANGGARELCLDDGSGYRTVTCATGSSCVTGECVECTLGQRRCSTDGKTLEECKRLPREDLSASYQPAGDNFDGACITQVCEVGASGPQCLAADCLPGAQRCAGTSTQQTCSSTGHWVDQVCSALPGFGATAECVNGACFDECSDAQRAKSYFGCEYWTTVMDNLVTPAVFKGNQTTAGMGTVDSEFAFVVANNSVQPTTLTVTRWGGTAPVIVKTVMVPSRNDPATKGIAQVRVPWHLMAPPLGGLGVSGRARYAYRLTTNRPVTVYQFNPLGASGRVGTCSNANQCNLQSPTLGPTCDGTPKMCTYFAYSNDASLLLPAHILGTSYVGLTPEHIVGRTDGATGMPSNAFNGTLSIVATADNTVVTVRPTARTLGGVGGVSALTPGVATDFTLAAYEVLQLSSDMPANVVDGTSTGNLQCADDPYDGTFSCVVGGNCDQLCRVVGADLTGTIVSSTKPIAVFGGSACTLRGYTDAACDHVEEQLFPYVTWGKTFVAGRSAPLRLENNAFATAANAGPDYYKIVAGCPDAAMNSPCPAGTTITLSAAPAAGDVLSGGGCETGTSLTANNCRLRSGKFIEFRSRASFTISASQPVQVSQTFAGQTATLGTTRPAQGDPSLILLPPVEQWRSTYTVLTAPGTRDNYLGIVVDDAKVAEVRVDGTLVASGWSTIASTTYKIVNVPVPVGSHAITVVPKPNQTTIPGAGVTVYGFDAFVSYGYTGGLDLTTIVTGVTPGG